jgi:error-prone DNA polymerase
MYIPLWTKSNYSFLEGASHPEELVTRAAELGLPAVAITDRDGLYGIVRAPVKARELGLRLLVGAQVTVATGERLLLLVRDRAGYRQLCRLLTTGRRRSPKGHSAVSWAEVCGHAAGLTALIFETADATARELGAAFGADLHVLLTRHRETTDGARETAARAFAARHGLSQSRKATASSKSETWYQSSTSTENAFLIQRPEAVSSPSGPAGIWAS